MQAVSDFSYIWIVMIEFILLAVVFYFAFRAFFKMTGSRYPMTDKMLEAAEMNSVTRFLGSEAGEILKTQITNAFIGSKFFKSGKFNPPIHFFNDHYIKGYCEGIIAALLHYGDTKAGRLSSGAEKLGMTISAYMSFCGEETWREIAEGIGKSMTVKDFEQGKMHGVSQIQLMNGMDVSKVDAYLVGDLYLKAAREMCSESDLWDIQSAFNKFTINRYIEENYYYV
ncbi:hypothetical protein OAQ23_05715 [Hellea sp.]|nr:hypothetical protein [Hellea sp.]